eukprot:m.331875 g.331875  ORF g.331875 m.331875 type:complete len:286 (-) comp20487_c0_seq5:728-1585(-)
MGFKNRCCKFCATIEGFRALVTLLLCKSAVRNGRIVAMSFLIFMDRWLNAGGSSSLLHYDNVENVMCVGSGQKKMLLISPENATKYRIPIDHPRGDYCGVNVSDIDTVQYHDVIAAPWMSITVNAGDCVYIPSYWVHYVESVGRTAAVNFWWTPQLNYSNSSSSDFETATPTDDPLSLCDVERHPHMQLRYQVYKYIKSLPHDTVSVDQMQHCVVHEHTLEPLLSSELLASIDTDGDDMLTAVEWETFDFPEMREDSDGGDREEIEAGAIYIRCRTENWLLDMLA